MRGEVKGGMNVCSFNKANSDTLEVGKELRPSQPP